MTRWDWRFFLIVELSVGSNLLLNLFLFLFTSLELKLTQRKRCFATRAHIGENRTHASGIIEASSQFVYVYGYQPSSERQHLHHHRSHCHHQLLAAAVCGQSVRSTAENIGIQATPGPIYLLPLDGALFGLPRASWLCLISGGTDRRDCRMDGG